VIKVCKGHTDQVFSVAFHPDGSLLASASHDSTVRIWDTNTAKTVLKLKGHENGATSVAFSPDALFRWSHRNEATICTFAGP